MPTSSIGERPLGKWQTHLIVFTPATWKGGEVRAPAYATFSQNGVHVQNHSGIWDSRVHCIFLHYKPDAGIAGPLLLQHHSHPGQYRNIWVRKI